MCDRKYSPSSTNNTLGLTVVIFPFVTGFYLPDVNV